MAKLSTIQLDENGQVVRVTHSDLPPSRHPPHVRKRIPSSPHKPVTTRTFYDLTQSETPSPGAVGDRRGPGERRQALQMEQENIVPGPFSHVPSQTTHKTGDTRKAQDKHTVHNQSTAMADRPQQQGIRKGSDDEVLLSNVGSMFMDAGALLPANSPLWKQSRVDIGKTSEATIYRQGGTSIVAPSIPSTENGEKFRSVSAAPSRATATPLPMPSNPPRTYSSHFIHPDTLLQRQTIDLTRFPNPGPYMSQRKDEEVLKSFFESALTPEDEDEEAKTDDAVQGEGKVDGLRVPLMKHQIEGLKFLQDHECQEEQVKKTKGKGKGKYGGILADDVYPKLTVRNSRWVLARQFKH